MRAAISGQKSRRGRRRTVTRFSWRHRPAGKLRALAAIGAKRATAAPHIPTLIEAGVPGYTVTSWYGLLAPAATPQAVVGRLKANSARSCAAPT
ncbi:MAG: hypothetical protein K2Y16_12735 [Burkholderiales bacterium]|nr:hypothetical protein [Burkholderiales bacterium]